MRKVKNKKAIRRLSMRSLRASRSRNLIAAAAIALTAMLFTALFTVGLGMVESVQESNMRSGGGDAHGVFKGLTQEEYDILKEHPLIKAYGKEMTVAYEVENPEFLKRHVEVHYVRQDWYPHWFFEIVDGKAPAGADEILLDETSMVLLGLEPRAGQQVTLKLRIHAGDQKCTERTFTVSGVLKFSDAMSVGFAIVSEAYLETYADEIEDAGDSDWDGVGKLNMDVFFQNSANIQEKLNQVITDSGYSVDPSSDLFIDSNANWAYVSDGVQSDPLTLLGLGGALVLILLTGYLIIYNIFQISVLQDVRYYGLLKTIGTTGRQIRRILRTQALSLVILGTPAGLVLGYAAGKLLLPLIMSAGSYDRESIHVSFDLRIFAGAAVFTVITVLLSVWKPARIAGKVSPVEAVRYTDQPSGRKKEKKSRGGARIWRMAFSNLGRSPGRTGLVICSLSLTVVLLNSVYTVTRSVDQAGMLSKMILCEAVIGNAALWNYDYYPVNEGAAMQNGLSETFVQACMQEESFADGGRIYMTMDASMPVDSWEIPDYIARDEQGVPGTWYESGFAAYSGYEEGAYQVDYYGIEEFVLSKMTVVEGETDKEKIWEKLLEGDSLLYATEVDDNNLVIEDSVKHHAGDKVILTLGDGREKEYEIVSVVKQHSYSLMNRMSNYFPYYVSAEEFLKQYSDAYLMSFLMDAKEGKSQDMEVFLTDYTTNAEPSMSYESRETYRGMTDQVVGTVAVVGTSLTCIIGMIGVLNFINTMLTSVVARRREFAMMEAVGMTGRQLKEMLVLEGVFYAVFTIVVSLFLSGLFSGAVLQNLGEGIWFMNYRFTLLPVAIAIPVLLLAGVLVPLVIVSCRSKESLVEQMRE